MKCAHPNYVGFKGRKSAGIPYVLEQIRASSLRKNVNLEIFLCPARHLFLVHGTMSSKTSTSIEQPRHNKCII